ncbi:hypothetical protein [Actinopolymorpha alba]|uniref:hypothetical protein n=1 Tax=Actinopolymorpha alba TaxID=533267 RepID=UPI000376843E|nr:hypothetical protein [Actinopolymorpha alba]
MRWETVLAHGIGERTDLPLPLDLVLQGAALALLVSFLGLGVLWRTPRFRGSAAGRPLPGVLQVLGASALIPQAVRACALALAVFTGLVAVAGPDDDRNLAPYVAYVLFWVGIPVASILVGPVWRTANPLRLVHRLLASLPGLPAASGLRPYPERLGHWPAAAGLLAFVWLELVAPGRTSPRVIALFFVTYAACQLVGALVYGDRWFERADGFEVYSTLLGHLAPLGRRDDGRLVVRNPFDGLAALAVRPGLVAVIAVCLGSTAYDSLGATPAWARLTQALPLPVPVTATAGLLLMCGVVAASYLSTTSRSGLSGGLAHSLVPVVAGYLLAHYYSLLVVEGQRALILASDPFGLGWNPLGLAGATPDESLTTAAIVAAFQLGGVLGGHLAGVTAAHDGALRLLPRDQQLAGQVPLLLVMVGYTVGGLFLLFAS